MKTVSISGSQRENVGKKDAKINRRQGKIPCVLYGGKEQLFFTADEVSLNKIINTYKAYIVNLNVNGKEYDSTIKDAHFHPVTDRILHVDFFELTPGKPVVIEIPVILEGSSAGIMKGGRMIRSIRKLKVEALKEHLPDDILINIEQMDIGDTVTAGDIKKDNIKVLSAPEEVLVGIRTQRIVVDEAAEAAAAAAAEAAAGTEAAVGADGKPVVGADGKPVVGADGKPVEGKTDAKAAGKPDAKADAKADVKGKAEDKKGKK